MKTVVPCRPVSLRERFGELATQLVFGVYGAYLWVLFIVFRKKDE